MCRPTLRSLKEPPVVLSSLYWLRAKQHTVTHAPLSPTVLVGSDTLLSCWLHTTTAVVKDSACSDAALQASGHITRTCATCAVHRNVLSHNLANYKLYQSVVHLSSAVEGGSLIALQGDDQALMCAYICWRSFRASARVASSMLDTWQARRACTGGPRGSQECRSILLPGRSWICMRGPGLAVRLSCQTPGRPRRDRQQLHSLRQPRLHEHAQRRCRRVPALAPHPHPQDKTQTTTPGVPFACVSHKGCRLTQQLSSKEAQT